MENMTIKAIWTYINGLQKRFKEIESQNEDFKFEMERLMERTQGLEDELEYLHQCNYVEGI
jgi:predicted  nucleic acid-binding Zn-ribbon protein